MSKGEKRKTDHLEAAKAQPVSSQAFQYKEETPAPENINGFTTAKSFI